VARETAATEWYRQLEERDTDQGSSTSEKEPKRGKTSWSDCVLIFLVFSYFILSLFVLVLSALVVSLAKK
jgi:hypothetical protein